MDKLFDIVPAERRQAARAALQLVLAAPGFTSIALLKGGISGALIYRVDCGSRSLAMRLEPVRVAPEHRRRGIAGMAAAAAIGVAPRLHFADPDSGIAIMDFIDARPLATHAGGRSGVVAELGALIAQVQTTPPFPTMSGDDGDMIAAALDSLAASGMFAATLLDRHRDELARIRAVVPWDPSALVSSHNDPNPRNLLYDGARLWLVDWELASRNDPLADLAVATLEIADTPALEAALLTAAFGHAPGAALRARLRVMQCLTRLFYGCIALDAAGGRQAGAKESLDALTPAQFHLAASQGRLAPDAIGTAFGKMSLAAFIAGCADPGFAQSLALSQTVPPMNPSG